MDVEDFLYPFERIAFGRKGDSGHDLSANRIETEKSAFEPGAEIADRKGSILEADHVQGQVGPVAQIAENAAPSASL